ncbi:hypothetical protein H4Q26_006835 [Puccinia striiformis f. sp. tritici PST-130]|nr:hypothetical protein H4Q26_006835 [Puccinia striiformis f. sp. tritici PST-130]
MAIRNMLHWGMIKLTGRNQPQFPALVALARSILLTLGVARLSSGICKVLQMLRLCTGSRISICGSHSKAASPFESGACFPHSRRCFTFVYRQLGLGMEPIVIFYKCERQLERSHSSSNPFAFKVEYMLVVRKIPHYTVLVPSIPPRPDLLLLGITYRRVPVLAINDTVYCDTYKIAEALESLYPHSNEHPSLFPKSINLGDHQSSILQKTLVEFVIDRPLFKLAVGLLPWDKLPKAFVEDREKLLGSALDVNQIKKMRPYTISQLRVYLASLEAILKESGSNFFMQTKYPGLLDISVYFVLRWLHTLGQDDRVYGPKGESNFPFLRKWVEAMRAYQESNKADAPSTRITGKEASQMIPEPPKIDAELQPKTDDEKLFGLGNQVAVVPDDSGKVPTIGRLVAIDGSTISIIVKRREESGRDCKVCFPRLGYNVLPASLAKASKI